MLREIKNDVNFTRLQYINTLDVENVSYSLCFDALLDANHQA